MQEKKERKKWGLIVFLVFIMIGTSFSFVFFGFSPVSEKIKYNGYTFTFISSQNIWIAKINGRQAAFNFVPMDVANINISGEIAAMLRDKVEIDVTYDINSTFAQPIALVQHQLGLVLAQYNIFVRKGFTLNNTFNLPIITCKDATLNTPVIYFKYSNTTQAHVDGNCIIAEAATDADIIKIKDRLLYGVLGVMN